MSSFEANALAARLTARQGETGTRSVLLVEDEPGIRTALTECFQREGWLVTAASGVREAEYRLGQGHFDLLVSDVRLPDGTGGDLLRAACAGGETPTVLMTAFGTVPDAVEAIRSGAGDYLLKPVAWKELRAVAERLTAPAAARATLPARSRADGLSAARAAAAELAEPALDRAGFDLATAELFGSVAGREETVPIRQLERLHLERTLALTRGNRTHAAEMLGISLRTVRNKIREYGLPPRRYA